MSTPDATNEQERPESGPIEKASRGHADETPMLALTGVTIVVVALVALVLGLSLLLYYLA
jgi:hypothetical protein